MNKGQLIEAAANTLGCSKAEATRAVDAVLDSIVLGVKHQEKVTIAGFGTFKMRRNKPRMGRNPNNGMPMPIPASVTMAFTASSTMKDRLD